MQPDLIQIHRTFAWQFIRQTDGTLVALFISGSGIQKPAVSPLLKKFQIIVCQLIQHLHKLIGIIIERIAHVLHAHDMNQILGQPAGQGFAHMFYREDIPESILCCLKIFVGLIHFDLKFGRSEFIDLFSQLLYLFGEMLSQAAVGSHLFFHLKAPGLQIQIPPHTEVGSHHFIIVQHLHIIEVMQQSLLNSAGHGILALHLREKYFLSEVINLQMDHRPLSFTGVMGNPHFSPFLIFFTVCNFQLRFRQFPKAFSFFWCHHQIPQSFLILVSCRF